MPRAPESRAGQRRTALSDADEVAEEARQVDEAGGKEGDDQHRMHRKTPKIGGRKESPDDSPKKIERDSGQESQTLFFAGFISCLRNAARFSGGREALMAPCLGLRRLAPVPQLQRLSGKALNAVFDINAGAVDGAIVDHPHTRGVALHDHIVRRTVPRG